MEETIKNLAEALGIQPEESNTAEVVESAISIVSEYNDLQEINSQLKDKLKENRRKFTIALEASEQERINSAVSEIQDETGHHLGGDHVKKAKMIAKKYIRETDDNKKQDLKNHLETYCIAYGQEIDLNKKLLEMTSDSKEEDTHQDEPDGEIYHLAEKYQEKSKEDGEEVSLQEATNFVLKDVDHAKEILNVK